MDSQQRHCCAITDGKHCAHAAEFEIVTQRRDGKMAGPDPYGDNTDACEEHVGHLLGWQPNMVCPKEVAWYVTPICVALGEQT